MENAFLGRFSGKFPVVMGHLERQSCFSELNVTNGNSCFISSKPSLVPFSGLQEEIYQLLIFRTICLNPGPTGLPM